MNKQLIISVSNRKGGTGKTTTSVNLAAQWALSGRKTLVIDLDTQGHCGLGLGVPDPQRCVHEIFTDPSVELTDVVNQSVIDNLHIAAADTHFSGLGINIDTDLLRQKIHNYLQRTDTERVVIDTPPTLDGLLISALTAADGVIIPFIPHHLAEVGVNQLAELFYTISVNNNNNLRLFGLLPIMQDRHLKIHRRVLDNLARQYGKQRLLRGIRSNIKLAEAFEKNVPIQQYAARSKGAMDYQLMTDELEYILFK